MQTCKEDDGVPQALDAVRRHPDLAATPLVVLVQSPAQTIPDADIALRRLVPPAFLLRRTREVLARARELRGRSTAIVRHSRALLDRSDTLTIAAEIDDRRRA